MNADEARTAREAGRLSGAPVVGGPAQCAGDGAAVLPNGAGRRLVKAGLLERAEREAAAFQRTPQPATPTMSAPRMATGDSPSN